MLPLPSFGCYNIISETHLCGTLQYACGSMVWDPFALGEYESHQQGAQGEGNKSQTSCLSCTLPPHLPFPNILIHLPLLRQVCILLGKRELLSPPSSLAAPPLIQVCTLLDKRERRKVVFEADYVGFVCPDEFVVGECDGGGGGDRGGL